MIECINHKVIPTISLENKSKEIFKNKYFIYKHIVRTPLIAKVDGKWFKWSR